MISMDTAMQVLVIIVSATLTLFLILAAVTLIAILRLIKSIRRVTDKAEQLVDKAEMVGEIFGKAAGPVAVGRLITNVADHVFKYGKKHKESDNG